MSRWWETAEPHHGLICCAGCGTLWKAPPLQAEFTMTPPPRDWREQGWQPIDPAGFPMAVTHSSVKCPLCGGTEVDVMRCQVPISMLKLLAAEP